MNLRDRQYPVKFWFTLHTYALDPKILLPKPKPRRPSTRQLTHGLDTLRSHLQSLIYFSSINRRKSDLRTGKYPLTSEQYSVMKKLGASHRYSNVSQLEGVLNLEYSFNYKGYVRGVSNLQFRLQTSKCAVFKNKTILFLRFRFHQKAPTLL